MRMLILKCIHGNMYRVSCIEFSVLRNTFIVKMREKITLKELQVQLLHNTAYCEHVYDASNKTQY